MSAWLPIVTSTVVAATPLIYAALGETVVEKSGVLNLGIEGMMLTGAVAGFAATLASGSAVLGFIAAAAAGMALALVFAVLTLSLQTNQVATGLALTLFGVGLSAFVGHDFAGTPLPGVKALEIPVLENIPVLGALLFHYDPLVYLSLVLYTGVSRFLYKSRAGLKMRAIGESPAVAHAIGHSVLRMR
ncbi:MAG: ABC transporter permease, partial [Burkholderiaceae bacterium]|nr:ABC transporter permease [Burkholderiaceae bacterium]